MVSNSTGTFTKQQRNLLQDQGYTVIPNTRKEKNIHAEERMIKWALQQKIEGNIKGLEDIGVSHKGGICTHFCKPLLDYYGVRSGNQLNERWRPKSNNPRVNEQPGEFLPDNLRPNIQRK